MPFLETLANRGWNRVLAIRPELAGGFVQALTPEFCIVQKNRTIRNNPSIAKPRASLAAVPSARPSVAPQPARPEARIQMRMVVSR